MGTRRACRLPGVVIASLVLGILCTMLGAPGAVAQISPPTWQLVGLPMRDGTVLATYVLVPTGSGPFPTFFQRTPYPPGWIAPLAGLGLTLRYAVVVQSVRGCQGSGGAALPFAGDDLTDAVWDGYDTVEWIARQPWSNGKVASFASSAAGVPIYGMMTHAPPHLVSATIWAATGNLYRDWVYPGGIWRQALLDSWLPSVPYDPFTQALWRAHPEFDSFWQTRDLTPRYRGVNIPAVHLGGWFDLFLPGTLDAFTACQYGGEPGARGRQRLLIGPWSHLLYQQQVGDLLFPPNAVTPPAMFANVWAWFEHTTRGVSFGIEREPAVCYYLMGDVNDPTAPGNVWRFADRFPPPSTPVPYYLTADGRLSPAPSPESGARTYTSDPDNPVPTVGGPHYPASYGPKNQALVEARPDVLTFTSEPLRVPLSVIGRVTAELWVSSDAPDTDFIARLCDVDADGQSFNVAEGALRARYRQGFAQGVFLAPDMVVPLTLDLSATAMVFNRGHSLRVQIASSSSPGYEVNPQTGPFLGPPRMALNTLYCDAQHPSRIILPVAP